MSVVISKLDKEQSRQRTEHLGVEEMARSLTQIVQIRLSYTEDVVAPPVHPQRGVKWPVCWLRHVLSPGTIRKKWKHLLYGLPLLFVCLFVCIPR